VALNLGGLAMSLTDAGRWDEAAARQAEAVDILARNLSNSRELIQYRGFLGAIHMRRKDYPAALAEYGRAVAAAEANLAKNDPLLASVLDGVASTYRLKGEAARAVPIFERVLEIERSRKAGPADLADAELGLARGLWDSRIDRARARRLAQQALVHAEQAKDKDAIETTQKWLADRAGK
jgi:tetratricopeptide (TPR) repeat protein